MNAFRIKKSQPLIGKVNIHCAKNSILPIMAASLLTDDDIMIEGVPPLEDVNSMREILVSLGKKTCLENSKLIISRDKNPSVRIPESSTRKLRASFLAIGPSLARGREISIAQPGGCEIGSRPVDLHLSGFSALGAENTFRGGLINVKPGALSGCKIYLPFPSVGATQNIMMASTLASGVTTIQNAAAEPEIEDLASFLSMLGADVKGAGTKTIVIEGVKSLHGAVYKPMADRIEAGTFMIAAAVTGGDLLLHNTMPKHLMPLISKLQQAGAELRLYPHSLRITAPKALHGVDITSMPYPGFPTDLQAQAMVMCASAQGVSTIVETIFENRFKHVPKLNSMGADIMVRNRHAIINGVKSLHGAVVETTDLRAGAAMILAGLIAEGETIVTGVNHIDRGYYKIEERLSDLGAFVSRINYSPMLEAAHKTIRVSRGEDLSEMNLAIQ